MSKRAGTDPESALSRWSRLKTAERDRRPASEPAIGVPPPSAPADVPAEVAARPAAADDPGAAAQPEAAIDPADLPDIDSLDESSDFRPFLQAGVPPELRRLALRKLWRINPVFRELDGLNDYDGDYSSMGIVATKIASLFDPATGRISRPDPAPDTDGEGDAPPRGPETDDAPERDAEQTARVADDGAADLDSDGAGSGLEDGDDEPA